MSHRYLPKVGKRTLIILAFFMIALYFVAALFAAQKPKETKETEIEKSLPHWQRVMISKFEGSKGGFGNVLIANFTIKNNNDIDMKDISIECYCYAKSGTILGRITKTIYDIFPAKKSKIIKQFNMGFMHPQTENVSCDIVSINPAK